jgi:tetratricopeptide (TPR) repeat protein
LRVAVYSICKNESQFVERWTKSARDADAIVVADTGSSDDTFRKLIIHGAAVHKITLDPWRFDAARNAALALVPSDIDICISLDLDEVLQEGWREAMEKLAPFTRLRYPFVWGHHPDGTPAVRYTYDKIHARRGYQWQHACHETLAPTGIEEVAVYTDDVIVHHWPDSSKPRNYVPLLEFSVQEEPHYPTNSHYLGREYFFQRRYIDAEVELRRHLTLRGALPAERCASLRYIAKCRIEQSDLAGAVRWLIQATEETPTLRDAWVDRAELAYFRHDWPDCLFAAEQALAIAHTPNVYMNDPRSFGPLAYDLASIASWHLGDHGKAAQYIEGALQLAPDDQRLQANAVLMLGLTEKDA